MTATSPPIVYHTYVRWVAKAWKPLLIAVYVAAFSCAASPKPIDLHLSTTVGYAPLSIRVRISIPPHADNRVVCLVYDNGEDYAISDCRDHGPNDPVSVWLEEKNLPEGEYLIFAELHRTDNVIVTPSQHLKVLAAFPQ